MGFSTRWLMAAASLAVVGAMAQPDRGTFLESLDPAARAAIGVDTMSPAQVAALETAVERYVGREVRRSTDGAVAAAIEAGPVSKSAEAAKPSLLERTKVLLAPGTDIEYSRIETTLTERFLGWEKGTRFKLGNGQTWRVTDGSYVASPEPAGKAVAIEPGAFGSFFLKFEGVRSRPRVELVGR